MYRRKFLAMAGAAALSQVAGLSLSGNTKPGEAGAGPYEPPTKGAARPLELGLMIAPASAPEETLRSVQALGLKTCFLSLDGYIGQFTTEKATQLAGLLSKYDVRATAVEVVGPKPLKWNFLEGPSTVSLVPRATRSARVAALAGASDFAKRLGVNLVQTHCGFIPENPADPLYEETVAAIRQVAVHCAANGQDFLMETGQETPTTMARALRDANQPNLGVGLDTANLILYGKAKPEDAIDILGSHIKSMHAKDGRWPTNPSELGEEVPIGSGLVDFKQVFSRLRRTGYTGAVTIEREISGPQQIEDVRKEKLYLERVLAET